MHITIRQLAVLEAVARNLSFTKAAEELHLTQPAVSMQIKQIEESIGLPLFEQVGKKVFLTEVGQEMYSYSRSIQQQLAEAEAIIEDLKGVKRGTLTIAVASTANYFAPRILAAFKETYDKVTFSLDVTNRKGLLSHLDNNDTDLVIMGRPPGNMEVEAEFFMENPLVAIAPANHPLVNVPSIPIVTLLKETFIIREEGSGTRNAIERFVSEHGFEITTSLSMSSNEAIKQAVQAGLGLGIVSIHTLEMELELKRLEVLDVDSFPILRNWYVVHRKGKRLSPVAKAFKDFVVSNARGILALKN
ncbi:MAG: LysR family transcriptional regulator [Gammaproteobacteria bacterium]|jgi:DNA-binding transcriptional LysR family regulator|nr:LysR family transcriptional regulator [Gammaproteobacteria bacterium]